MNKYIIRTDTDVAPVSVAAHQWAAWFGVTTMRCSVPTGDGETEEEAIRDLVANYDLPVCA